MKLKLVISEVSLERLTYSHYGPGFQTSGNRPTITSVCTVQCSDDIDIDTT